MDLLIRSIDKAWLARRFGKPRLRDLEIHAIGEIYVGRKNKYFTIVIDWKTGAIVYVGDGKGQQVLDCLHITKLMNDQLTQLLRDVQSEGETMDHKALKGLRWLLLKHSENLDESKNERVRLQEALELNRSLSVAYYLKEDLSQIWQQATRAAAARFLTDWCRRARASGIRVLLTMANTLEGYCTGILNWYDYPISSGPMEGINNRLEPCREWHTGTETRSASS